jgi:hypothetical protein
MPTSMRVSTAFMTAAVAAAILGCSDGQSPSGATTSPSAAAPATQAPSASAPTPSATATATATAATPRDDCPKGSAGEGTLKAPCDAKGNSRMMEATWTGKMDDAGPSFRVINKSDKAILYGRIVVYFYDQAGKQIELKGEGDKTKPNHPCFGNLFGGIMKPGEKAVITFSCVKKEHVPEGAKAIEGELQIVGFADATEKKSEFYWRNNDLVPDARPKGGVK